MNTKKEKNIIRRGQSGFMLVEVLVAVAIIAVSVLAAMGVTQKAVAVSRQAFHATQAAALLEEGAEGVRIVRDNDWDSISSLTLGTDYYLTYTGNTWTLSTTPSTIGIFTRKIRMSAVKRNATTADIANSGNDDPDTKMITTTVTWTESGVTVTKTLSIYLMNIF